MWFAFDEGQHRFQGKLEKKSLINYIYIYIYISLTKAMVIIYMAFVIYM